MRARVVEVSVVGFIALKFRDDKWWSESVGGAHTMFLQHKHTVRADRSWWWRVEKNGRSVLHTGFGGWSSYQRVVLGSVRTLN